MSNLSYTVNREGRVFNESEARRIIDEIVSYMSTDGRLYLQVESWWGAGQRWARNRASLTSDQREVYVSVGRIVEQIPVFAVSNQTDSESLKGLTDHSDFYYNRWKSKIPPDRITDTPRSNVKGAEVWSDETFNQSVVDNASSVEKLTRDSEEGGLVSSGYIETTGSTSLKYFRDEWGRETYHWGRVTQAQCSVTVRDPRGKGSSWAGSTSFDIKRVNIPEIAALAFEKSKKSLNPVRIEPGRYQVILEPQASATLTGLFMNALSRSSPERFGIGSMFLGFDQSIERLRSKLGLKVIDDRLNIFHEPSDPVYGTHFAPLHGRVDYVKKGVLSALIDDYHSHLNEVSDIHPAFPTTSYTVRGGDKSLEDMIASTRRALLVVRLSQPELLDGGSMLFGGVTRDGLWLIENGVITKSVRNFRWTESPLFALNNLEEIGREVQVFDPVTVRHPFSEGSFARSLNNVVVPPLKINDFSFTSTIDAI